MSKQTGLASALYIGGSDLSGDTQGLSKVSGSRAVIDTTDITQTAVSRLLGHADGGIDWTSYFDPATSHPVLSALPTSDVVMTFLAPALAIGTPGACMVAKQINYDGTRGTDGSFTFAVSGQANSYGLEWGVALTAGMRTDTTATQGTSYDTAASASFGGQAYLHCSAFVGTDVTIKIQDSADNSTFADVTSFGFTQVTGSTPLSQRIAIGNTATIRRYVAATTVTSAGFTSVTFAVVMAKNKQAGVVF
jgi:hypothetical protein